MELIKHRLLDSGLNLYVMEDDFPMVSAQLWTPFGGDTLKYSDADTDRTVHLQPGCAHYFEHVLHVMPPLGRNGKPIKWRTRTPKRMKGLRDGLSEMENQKALMVNAYTWNDITNYYFITTSNVEQNLTTLLDYALTFYLPQDRCVKEFGIISDEIRRSLNRPDDVLDYAWIEQAYRIHGARNPVLGSVESISKISLDDLASLHDTFYRPSNMSLFLTGPVDIDEAAKVVNAKLGLMGKGAYLPPPEEVSQKEPEGVVVPDNFSNPLRRIDVARPKILGGWRQVLEPTAMSKEQLVDRHVATGLAMQALFGHGSRNRRLLVEQGIDERSFGSGASNFRDHCEIQVMAYVEDPEKFRALIAQSAADALSKGIPEEEIEYARNSELVDMDNSLEDVLLFGQHSARWGVLTRDPRDALTAIERYENITAEEVNALLPKLLDPENLTFCLMVPDE